MKAIFLDKARFAEEKIAPKARVLVSSWISDGLYTPHCADTEQETRLLDVAYIVIMCGSQVGEIGKDVVAFAFPADFAV